MLYIDTKPKKTKKAEEDGADEDIRKRVNPGKNGWEQLAFAIVMTAVNDYRAVLRQLRLEPLPNTGTLEQQDELLDFFYSDWFAALTRLNPDDLIDSLEEEAKQNDR